MKWSFCLLPALLLGLLGCTAGGERTAEAGRVPIQPTRIDSLVAPLLDPGGPGCAIAVYQEGEIVFERGYGLANMDWRTPITSGTVFDIASVSKQFTAAAILMLAEQGKLSLDDDIRRFVPEFPDYGSRVEIRHLLHHTSGIRDWVWLLALGGIPFENVLSRQDLYSIIYRQKALAFAPGERYQYSNSGYNLLALIVERASGRPFTEFVTKEIFEPLGMRHTRILDDRRMTIPNRAFGYLPNEDGGYGMEQYFNPAMAGSSNIHSSVNDLLLWDQNFYNHTVGPSDLTRRLEERGVLNSGDTVSYACGLEIGEHRGLRTVSHTGDWAGFLACFLRFPEQRLSVVCLANTQAFSPSRLCYKIVDLYLTGQYGLPAPQPDEEKPPVERIPVTADTARYADYAGTYEREDGRKLKVKVDKGRLFGFSEGRRRFELLPLAADHFFLKYRDELFSFVRDEQGAVNRLEWGGGERTETYFSPGNLPPDSLTPSAIEEYAGEYFSDELMTTYRIEVRDGRLMLNTPMRSRYLMDSEGISNPDILRYDGKDSFSFAFLHLNFERDRRGRISGFELVHQWAALSLKFEKKQSAGIR